MPDPGERAAATAGAPAAGPRAPVWRHRLALLVLVLASLAVRVHYYRELSRGPCIWMHRWNVSDMSFFDAWARHIAGGDWLTDRSLHPYHDWHDTVARQYLGTPTVRPADGQALWDHWYGGKRFHQEPLYAYFVAAIYALLSPDPRWVLLVQLGIGVLNNVLIYLLARRHFGELAGVAAGLLALFCGPLLYYELILVRSSLSVFAALASTYLLGRALLRDSWPWWLGTGLALGLAILLRLTFVLFALGILGVLIVQTRRRPAELARRAGVLAGGIGLGLAPAVARNLAVGVSPLEFSSVGAVTFVMANTVDYPPNAGGFVSSAHTARIMAASDGRFLPAVRATLRTHPGVWSYLRQLAGKFTAVWHWYEFPNNTNFYYFRLRAAALRWAWVTFAVVAPLGLVGLGLSLRKPRSAWPLHLLVLSLLAGMLILYVISRFRAPLLAALIPFAGGALAHLVACVRARRALPALPVLATAAALGLWVSRPLAAGQPLIRTVDYLVPHEIYYGPAEQAARAAGNWHGVAHVLGEALRWLPPAIDALGDLRPAQSPEEARLAAWGAALHQRYAEALRQSGHAPEADAHAARAAELDAAARALPQQMPPAR